ncbi:MAG: S9 family peptidase [Cyclobacteriaceae bacterium]
MLRFPLLLTTLLLGALCASSQEKKDPTFEEIISTTGIGTPQLSPDGTTIIFQKGSTDWENNRFDTEIWMSREGQTPFQLTNNSENSSNSPRWSPNGKWIAYLSDRGNKRQIQIMRTAGGESFELTKTKNGVSVFRWSPDGGKIAFTQSEDRSKEKKSREEKYGAFSIEDNEYSLRQLWLMDFKPDLLGRNWTPQEKEDSTLMASLKPMQLMDSAQFSINSFEWSPNGKMIAFGHQPDPILISFMKSDISIYDIEKKEYRSLVANRSVDGLEAWSPDSKSILYSTNLDDSISNFYKNDKLYRINVNGKNNVQLATSFDENIGSLTWNEKGIFGIAWQKTLRPMVQVDPKNGDVTTLTTNPARVYNYSFSKDASQLVIRGANDDTYSELYTTEYPISTLEQITRSTDQISSWKVSNSEVISWPSEDGAMIEGVLHKPQDYDPNKKYPLLVVIHGGPTGISTPAPTPAYVYPMVQWLNKGALVLQPNYRGSAGYGEDFRSLNVENLGVGDAWDVLSGVKYLEDQGIIDGDKVGSMGWSQGGYISAFLTTNSDKFKAISVGAGISNWMTYYVNTDIHPFTRQYLKATPWSDKEIYEKTSPMTNINNAKTPTLIQHGEFDRRVPTPNGYELFQGLQDVGVETKLIIYKGFGHGITKPKERLAAMWHNWQWFGRYIWGEEIEMPEKK